MILGISGLAGAGKDTIAEYLAKNQGFVRVALADPLKRICRDVFAFSDEQLFGPSEKRNEPDERYHRVRLGIKDLSRFEYLTPRYALQRLGSEWGRDCYENVWVDYTLRVAKEILDGGFVYTPQKGLESEYGHPLHPQYPYKGVVIPDVRFRNEMEAIRKAGGRLWRVIRPGAGLQGEAGKHSSEQEQQSIQNLFFDAIIYNDRSIADLYETVERVFYKVNR